MHRSVTTAWCLAVVVSVVVAPTMANEETTPAADATSLPPEREGPAADAPTATLAVAESEELGRLGARFEREIRQLEALAREVKGLELVGLQRRIESLKLEQRAEELRTDHPERTRCRQCHVPVTTRATFEPPLVHQDPTS